MEICLEENKLSVLKKQTAGLEAKAANLQQKIDGAGEFMGRGSAGGKEGEEMM